MSVNNTSAMIGCCNSVASRFVQKNPYLLVAGRPCYLTHIAASYGNDGHSTLMNLNIVDVCIDSYYWFDKSSKKKGKLVKYAEFCNQEYQGVLKPISFRWLSLEHFLARLLKKIKKIPKLEIIFRKRTVYR